MDSEIENMLKQGKQRALAQENGNVAMILIENSEL
jgi:hypothetical protein